MKAVVVEVCAPSAAMADFVERWKTGKLQESARIAFANQELLKALCGAGSVSIVSEST